MSATRATTGCSGSTTSSSPSARGLPSPLGSSSGPAPTRCGRCQALQASCTPARSSARCRPTAATSASRSIPLLNSGLAQAGDYLRVAYGQAGGREPRLLRPSPATPAGTVLAESDKLQQGLVAASVRMRRAGVVVLSASFDPGWTATVDGRRQRTEMVAPALVATTVPAGTHRVIFRYRGWQDYPLLLRGRRSRAGRARLCGHQTCAVSGNQERIRPRLARRRRRSRAQSRPGCRRPGSAGGAQISVSPTSTIRSACSERDWSRRRCSGWR